MSVASPRFPRTVDPVGKRALIILVVAVIFGIVALLLVEDDSSALVPKTATGRDEIPSSSLDPSGPLASGGRPEGGSGFAPTGDRSETMPQRLELEDPRPVLAGVVLALGSPFPRRPVEVFAWPATDHGAPWSSSQLRQHLHDRSDPVRWVWTDEEGRFSFDDLPRAGDQRFRIVAGGEGRVSILEDPVALPQRDLVLRLMRLQVGTFRVRDPRRRPEDRAPTGFVAAVGPFQTSPRPMFEADSPEAEIAGLRRYVPWETMAWNEGLATVVFPLSFEGQVFAGLTLGLPGFQSEMKLFQLGRLGLDPIPNTEVSLELPADGELHWRVTGLQDRPDLLAGRQSYFKLDLFSESSDGRFDRRLFTLPVEFSDESIGDALNLSAGNYRAVLRHPFGAISTPVRFVIGPSAIDSITVGPDRPDLGTAILELPPGVEQLDLDARRRLQGLEQMLRRRDERRRSNQDESPLFGPSGSSFRIPWLPTTGDDASPLSYFVLHDSAPSASIGIGTGGLGPVIADVFTPRAGDTVRVDLRSR